MMFNFKGFLFFVFSLISFTTFAQGDCTLEVCNEGDCGPVFVSYSPSGANVFCEGGMVVLQNESSTTDFDEFTIDWGDGTVETYFDYSNISHTYDYSGIDRCEEGPNFNQFICYVGTKTCAEGTSCNWAQTVVTVKLQPVALFDLDEQICISDPVSPINQSCNEESYFWEFDDGFTSTEENPSHTFSTPGFHSITLTVTNECGSDQITKTIEVVGLPIAEANFTLDPATACLPVIIDFTNLSQNAAFVEWIVSTDEGDGWMFFDTNYTHFTWDNKMRFFVAEEYDVTLEVTNVCGTDTWTETLTILQAPTVNLSHLGNHCQTAEIEFCDFVMTSGSIFGTQWTVTDPNGNIQTFNQGCPPEQTFTIPGTYTVLVEVDGGECGTVSDENTFTIQTPGDPDFTQPNFNICTGTAPFMLEVSPPNGTWSGSSAVSPNGLFNPSIAGVGSVTLNYDPPGSCVNEGSITLQVLAPETVSIPDDQVICIDKNAITLSFSPMGGEWEGTGITNSLSGIFDPQTAGVGIHELTYIYSDGNDCETTMSLIMEVEQLPEMTIPDTVLFCDVTTDINLNQEVALELIPDMGTLIWSGPGVTNGANGTFNSNQAGANGTGEYLVFLNYQLQDCEIMDSLLILVVEGEDAVAPDDMSVCISDNTLPLFAEPSGGIWSGLGIDPISGIIDLNLAGGGNQTYTYTIFPNSTCESSDATIINIIDLSAVSAGNDVGYCESENIITLSQATPTGGTWSGTGLIDAMAGTVDIQQLTVGNHTFTYSVESNQADCDASDDLILTVHPLPIPSFISDGSFCVDEPIIFENTTDTGGNLNWDFDWDFGDNSSGMGDSLVHTYTSLGDYEITLIVTTEHGCTASISEMIHISEPPSLVAFSMDTDEGCAELAVNITNLSQGENIAYLWDFGNGQTSTDLNPPTIIYEQGMTDTTYYIQLSVGNGCGDENFIDSVLVHPQPVSNFGTNLNNYCSGDTVFFANTSFGDPLSYCWDYGNGNIVKDSMPIPQIYFTDSIPDFIEITLITENLCGIDTLTKELEINPTNVSAFFNTDPTEICQFDTVFFTNFSTLGATLEWDFGDGNQSAEANPFHIYQDTGIFKVVHYAKECGFDSITTNIIVKPIPEVNFEMAAQICLGETLEISSTSIDVNNSFWTIEDSLFSQITNPEITLDSVGFYEIELTGVSENGCEDTFAKSVEVLPLPVPDFLQIDSICAGTEFNLPNFSTGNIISCDWDLGDGNESADCEPTHSFENSGNFLVQLSVTDINGCRDSVTKIIHVREKPTADFSFEILNQCDPATIMFQNESLIANNFYWSFDDDSISTQNNPNHIYLEAGTFTVDLIVSNDNICFDSTFQTLTIHPTPTADFTLNPTDLCAEALVSFNDISSGNILDYNWNFGDGTFDFEQNPSHLFTLPGIFSVSLKIETEFCEDSTTQIIEIFEPVTADFSQNNIDCFGESTGSIDLMTTSGTAPFSFIWSNGAELEDIENLPAGTYQVTITDINGCTFSESLTLIQPPSIGALVLENNTVTCFGGSDGSLLIQATGGTPNYTYLWETGSTNPLISDLMAGNYAVSITDNNGCLFETNVDLAENQEIQYEAELLHISCFNEADGFFGLTNIFGGQAPYDSISLTGNFGTQVGNSFPNLPPDFYELFIQDSLGCFTTDTIEIIEPAEIYVDIKEEFQRITLGCEVDLTTDFNGFNPSFIWDSARFLDCDTCSAPLAIPHETTHYAVTMTDEFGCTATDSLTVIVDIFRKIYIPDGLTPNGDGINDNFTIRLGNSDKSVEIVREFKVFNRWGETIFAAHNFQPNDTNFGWDGKYRGKVVPPAVYVYYAEIEFVDGFVKVYSGDITILH